MRPHKGFIAIKVLLLVFAVVFVAGGTYYFTHQDGPMLRSISRDISDTLTALPEVRTISTTRSDTDNFHIKDQQQPEDDITSVDTIKVLSPNGGEAYTLGDTVSLISQGGHRSDTGEIENGYFLVDSKGIAKEIGYAGNAFAWKIMTYRDESSVVPGTYKLRVMSSFGPCPNPACAQTITDESDSTFTITK